MTLIAPEVQAIIDELRRENAELRCENAELRARLARYEGRPPTDPSTPSGMTAPYLKPKRKKGKRPGREQGHKGARRATPKAVNNHEHHSLTHCPDCGTQITAAATSTRTRIIEDIAPPAEPKVTGHTIEQGWCSKCKKRVEAKVDAALPRCTLGLRVALLTAWMHYAIGTTGHAVVKYLRRVHRFTVTAGGLTQTWSTLAAALKPLHDAIFEEIKLAGVLYADETSWRVGGQTFWLWCFTTKTAAYYLIDRTRGSPVVRRILGESFEGVLVSDFYAAYGFVCAVAKQKCLAHLLRELEKVSLRNDSSEWRAFAAKLKRLLKDALRLGLERQKLGDEEYDRRWHRLYDRLSALHDGVYWDHDCVRLAKRLAKYRFELFTFLERDNVDATNNHGERTIRPAVQMRKNYYGNRSLRGAEVQAELMTIFRTLEMRGVDPLEYLESSLREHLGHRAALMLPLMREDEAAAA